MSAGTQTRDSGSDRWHCVEGASRCLRPGWRGKGARLPFINKHTAGTQAMSSLVIALWFWAAVELTTQKALGCDAYESAWASGAAMGTDEAAAYGRRARGE